MSIDLTILTYVTYGITGIVVLLIIWIIVLQARLGRFMKGESGKSLEGVIKNLDEREKELEGNVRELEKVLKRAEKKIEKGVGNIGIVKFNAFRESGGDQSFAAAFLDREGTGVLLSSLYTRDRTSLYIKEVKQYNVSVKLLPEERRAIEETKYKKEASQ